MINDFRDNVQKQQDYVKGKLEDLFKSRIRVFKPTYQDEFTDLNGMHLVKLHKAIQIAGYMGNLENFYKEFIKKETGLPDQFLDKSVNEYVDKLTIVNSLVTQKDFKTLIQRMIYLDTMQSMLHALLCHSDERESLNDNDHNLQELSEELSKGMKVRPI